MSRYNNLIEADLHPRQVLARIANAISCDLESGSHHMNNAASGNFHRLYKSLNEELGKIADELDAFEPLDAYTERAEKIEATISERGRDDA